MHTLVNKEFSLPPPPPPPRVCVYVCVVCFCLAEPFASVPILTRSTQHFQFSMYVMHYSIWLIMCVAPIDCYEPAAFFLYT